MKRILSVMIVLMMLCNVMLPVVTHAASVVTISLPEKAGNRGDTVEVNVNISSGSQMQAFGFEMAFDSSVLEIVSAVKGDVLKTSPIINTNISNKIVFSYAATTPITSAGSVLKITFKIRENAAYGESPLKLTVKEFANGKFESIAYTVEDGLVYVNAPVLERPDSIELISVTSSTAEILWAGIENATGYNVYLNGSLYNTEPVVENKVRIEGLTLDTEYEVCVTSLHYNAESEKSSAFTFRTSTPQLLVTFVGWQYTHGGVLDGNVIDTQWVEYGSDAIAPEAPFREGYDFIGWDSELTNITSDKVIQAQYAIKTYTVRFLDEDGTVLATQSVEHGSNATPPDDPTKEGWIFAGWNSTGENITKDMDITALYRVKSYTVTFVDENGETLVEYTFVEQGDSVTPPNAPEKEGYDFIGWSESCDNISTDLVISPQYAIKKHTVTFLGLNQSVIATVSVEHGAAATAPAAPAIEGYAFKGWDKLFNNIVSDLTVTAIYEIVDENVPKYEILGATGTAGSEVEVYVAIANNPGIISLRNKISYDTTTLELLKVENLGLLNGYTTPSATITSPYTLRWADSLATANNTANGNIVKLTFLIKEGTETGDYLVSVDPVEARNFDGTKIAFNAATANVTVIDYIPGDSDGDGEVSDWDAIMLNRYLAGWSVELGLGADADGDGEVSDWDAIILERYLAGWNVELGK